MRPPPLLLTATLLLVAGPPVRAQVPKSDVDFVPTTAGGFVTVKVADLMTLDALKPAREAIAKIETMEGRKFTDALGVSWDEIDRVTVFWPTPLGNEPPEPYVVVRTKTPFNEAKVLKALRAMPPGKRHHGRNPGLSAPASKAEDRPAPPTAPPPKGPPVPQPKFGLPREDNAQEPRGAGQPARPAANEDAGSADGPDLYYLDRGPLPAVYLLDDRTLFFLSETDNSDPLIALVGQLLRRKADGPLAAALAEADKHTIVAATRISPTSRFLQDPAEMPRDWIPFRSLFKARTAMLTADVAAKTAVTARLTFADGESARRAEPVFKTLIQLVVDTLAERKKDVGKDPDWASVLSPVLDLVAGALEKADVKTDGTTVVARVEAEIGPALAKAAAGLPDKIEIMAARSKSMNNLKQIGLAIHNYHDTNGFIPTNVLGPDGKALLSWRVLLLPYLEQDNIYKQIDLTKAWDDPRNAKALEKMPAVFRVHGRDAKDKTYFQMPTAPQQIPGGDPFQVVGRRMTLASIQDGTSNTLMVVEAADAVDWAKPDDLVYDPKKLPPLGDPAAKHALILLGDGSVRKLNRNVSAEVLKALFTINGGEVASIPD